MKCKLYLLVFLAFLMHLHGYTQSISDHYFMGKGIELQFTNHPRWINFVSKFHSIGTAENGKISILHIGDSHIQGGFFSNHLRELFTGINIKTGRGMAFPYSLSKIYNPPDLTFFSKTNWKTVSVSKENRVKIGIAGYELVSFDSIIDLTIKSNCPSSYNIIRLYHNNIGFHTICNVPVNITNHKMNESVWYTEYTFYTCIDSVCLKLIPNEKNKEFKVELLDFENAPDVFLYHSLGINGMTFERYKQEVDYLPWVRHIKPDCIIISFGTNDAYAGKVDPVRFKRIVSEMVDDIYGVMTNSIIILSSPNDHFNKRHLPNRELPVVRNIIKEVASEKGCLFWDFYEIMGGSGSAQEWFKKGWMYKDLIHLSKEGYKQQAKLFFNSFMYSLENTDFPEQSKLQ